MVTIRSRKPHDHIFLCVCFIIFVIHAPSAQKHKHKGWIAHPAIRHILSTEQSGDIWQTCRGVSNNSLPPPCCRPLGPSLVTFYKYANLKILRMNITNHLIWHPTFAWTSQSQKCDCFSSQISGPSASMFPFLFLNLAQILQPCTQSSELPKSRFFANPVLCNNGCFQEAIICFDRTLKAVQIPKPATFHKYSAQVPLAQELHSSWGQENRVWYVSQSSE